MISTYRVNMEVATTEDLYLSVALTNASGGTLDLTAAALTLSVETGFGVSVLTASTANGRIVIVNAIAGLISVNVPASVIGAIAPGVYAHDLLLVQAGERHRLWSGTLNIQRGVPS